MHLLDNKSGFSPDMRVTGVLEYANSPYKFWLHLPSFVAWRTSSIVRHKPCGESGVAADGLSEGGRVTGRGGICVSGVSICAEEGRSSLLARLEIEKREDERAGWRSEEGRALYVPSE